MQELPQNQIEVIESALVGIRITHNSFDVEPYLFLDVPDDLSSLDLSSLDFIPCELQMTAEFAVGSLAFSLA